MQRRERWVVLREDVYETRFGDGYFAYVVHVAPSEAEARAWIAHQPTGSATNELGYAFHVRKVTLERAEGSAQWVVRGEVLAGERIDIDDLLSD